MREKIVAGTAPLPDAVAGNDGGGAYLLCLEVPCKLVLEAGSLGKIRLAPGRYVYVGGARRNVAARVARHCRLACRKSGKRHWHIDYVLAHAAVRLDAVVVYWRAGECALSRRVARRRGVSVAVPHFGASDCRCGCRAHLYRLKNERAAIFPAAPRARPPKYRINIVSEV